jgi:hypothetical protein
VYIRFVCFDVLCYANHEAVIVIVMLWPVGFLYVKEAACV